MKTVCGNFLLLSATFLVHYVHCLDGILPGPYRDHLIQLAPGVLKSIFWHVIIFLLYFFGGLLCLLGFFDVVVAVVTIE